jgi:hypothetical protein
MSVSNYLQNTLEAQILVSSQIVIQNQDGTFPPFQSAVVMGQDGNIDFNVDLTVPGNFYPTGGISGTTARFTGSVIASGGVVAGTGLVSARQALLANLGCSGTTAKFSGRVSSPVGVAGGTGKFGTIVLSGPLTAGWTNFAAGLTLGAELTASRAKFTAKNTTFTRGGTFTTKSIAAFAGNLTTTNWTNNGSLILLGPVQGATATFNGLLTCSSLLLGTSRLLSPLVVNGTLYTPSASIGNLTAQGGSVVFNNLVTLLKGTVVTTGVFNGLLTCAELATSGLVANANMVLPSPMNLPDGMQTSGGFSVSGLLTGKGATFSTASIRGLLTCSGGASFTGLVTIAGGNLVLPPRESLECGFFNNSGQNVTFGGPVSIPGPVGVKTRSIDTLTSFNQGSAGSTIRVSGDINLFDLTCTVMPLYATHITNLLSINSGASPTFCLTLYSVIDFANHATRNGITTTAPSLSIPYANIYDIKSVISSWNQLITYWKSIGIFVS